MRNIKRRNLLSWTLLVTLSIFLATASPSPARAQCVPDLEKLGKLPAKKPAATPYLVILGAGDVVERFYIDALVNNAKIYDFKNAFFFDFSRPNEPKDIAEKRARIKSRIESSGFTYIDRGTPEGKKFYEDFLAHGPGGQYDAILALPGKVHFSAVKDLLAAKTGPAHIYIEKPVGGSLDDAIEINEITGFEDPRVVAMDHYRYKVNGNSERSMDDLRWLDGLSFEEFVMTQDRSGSDPHADIKKSAGRDGSIENEGRVEVLAGGTGDDMGSHGLGLLGLHGRLDTVSPQDVFAYQYTGLDGDPNKRTDIPKETFFAATFKFRDNLGNIADGKMTVGKGIRTKSYGPEYEHAASLWILTGRPNAQGQKRKIIFDLRSTGPGSPSTATYYDYDGSVFKKDSLERFPYQAFMAQIIGDGKTDHMMTVENAVTIRQKLQQFTRKIGTGVEIPTHQGGMAKTDKFPGRPAAYAEDIIAENQPIGGPHRVKISPLPKYVPRDRDMLVIGGTGTMGKGASRRFAAPLIGDFKVAISTPDASAEQVISTMDHGSDIKLFRQLDEAVASLKKDSTTNRKMMLLVPNAKVFDIVATQLEKLLEPGDIIIDGGNSDWQQTEKWQARLASKGIRLLGMGVSGGERGAWNGQAMMVGGDKAAWEEVRPYFEKIAAPIRDINNPTKTYPSVVYVGPGGAGHFVKMIHNGIEYVELQILLETYEVLRNIGGLTIPEVRAVFEEWNKGPLHSYLLDTTIEALKLVDPKSNKPLVEVVVPVIEQKGTGLWATQNALGTSTYAPALATAVFERFGTALYDETTKTGPKIRLAPPSSLIRSPDISNMIADLKSVVYNARLMSFIESLDVMKRSSSVSFQGQLDIPSALGIWRTGSILQGPLLDSVYGNYLSNPQLPTLLDVPSVNSSLSKGHAQWIDVVHKYAGLHGARTPILAALLYDLQHYGQVFNSGASLIALVRDWFGKHLYERTDAPRGNKFHHDGDHEIAVGQ